MEILQIIPADGWYAEYKPKGGRGYKTPLVCWDLVSYNDGPNVLFCLFAYLSLKTSVCRLTPTEEGFQGYDHPERDDL